jgi:hypothetical protein
LLARILVVEEELGIASGHAEARAAIARWLDRIEMCGGQNESRAVS